MHESLDARASAAAWCVHAWLSHEALKMLFRSPRCSDKLPLLCRGLLTLIRAGEGCSMLGGSCQHKSSPDSLDSRHGCCELVYGAQSARLDVLTICLMICGHWL